MPYFIKHSVIAVCLIYAGLLYCSPAFAKPAASGSGAAYDSFLQAAFAQVPSKPKVLWLDRPLKAELKDLFDYSFGSLRIRYWQHNTTTAWILDEIGKEQPITMGVVIAEGNIKAIEVLKYRESRGGEIKHPFFTEQFYRAKLTQKNRKAKLSKNIDGISGATLSVRAMTKVAKVALYLHARVAPVEVAASTPQKPL